MSSSSTNARRRKQQFPRYSSTAKETLEPVLVASVDVCLKSLRKITRRLSSTIEAHALDVKILERIVYKSKNQHKNSLFWRNLTEIRRLATRVEEVGITALVDNFRSSFYSEATTKSAWKNAPWTQVPDNTLIQYVLDRVAALCFLYVKAIEAYQRAFRAYERFANTTSFLPLSLSLLGICARLSLLTADIDHVSVQIWDDIHRLLATSQPAHSTCRCKRPVLHTFSGLGLFIEQAKAINQPSLSAELGEAIPRDIIDFQQPLTVEELPSIAEGEKMAVDNPPLDDDETITFEIETPIIQSITTVETHTIRSEKAPIPSVKQPKKPKKRVIQDEIDDILG